MSNTQASAPIPLPNWTDPTSIASFVIALATLVIGTLTATGVAIPAGVSGSVQGWASVAGYAIALGVMAFNQWRISSTHKAAIAAGHATYTAATKQLLRDVALNAAMASSPGGSAQG